MVPPRDLEWDEISGGSRTHLKRPAELAYISSEQYHVDCPGKGLRYDLSYEDYVRATDMFQGNRTSLSREEFGGTVVGMRNLRGRHHGERFLRDEILRHETSRNKPASSTIANPQVPPRDPRRTYVDDDRWETRNQTSAYSSSHGRDRLQRERSPRRYRRA